MTKMGKILLIMYVNDIIITGNDTQVLKSLRFSFRDNYIPKAWASYGTFGGLRLPSLRTESICPKGSKLWTFWRK